MALHLENLPRTIYVERVAGEALAEHGREACADTAPAEREAPVGGLAAPPCGGSPSANLLAAPRVVMIDQRRLPGELAWISTDDWQQVVDAVKALAVRGAPAIGVAGAAAVMLAAFELAAGRSLAPAGNCDASRPAAEGRNTPVSAEEHGGATQVTAEKYDELPSSAGTRDDAAHQVAPGDEASSAASSSPALFAARLRHVARQVAEARPTAVNLSWAVGRALETASEALKAGDTPQQAAEALYKLTKALIAEDEAANRAIGANGAALLRPLAQAKGAPLNILTHCNAGSLATAFYGTALGVVYAAAEEGLVARVYADETRPVGQGARLTAWELARAGVPVTLICDNMAASLMAQGRIDAVVVGADRIAANGDAANKIGTLGVAVLARHFGVPFFVAAPESTRDGSCAAGADIPIEQRSETEVLPSPIEGVEVFNPAFDVTPAALIAAIVTEKGVWKPGE
ncbi:S-methyl-5-thioribose-1-phosphate isomerase [Adlercreutzia sp. R21]|uniref:S-methyl-5-thioribose-1-phosphate isomerase n=1 Tax=Adlercreutzia wanghongyangiae TaxID=3111451 RepID=UPI002DB84BA8|nr:S-methyl-5-thioribose-1-phosphate isomerase [Adlercreutzia sp. R21]MEC4183699.1 S-methyl-5-thioribose-1-phosphate isomerase [Adlercreutzia sp. R21]